MKQLLSPDTPQLPWMDPRFETCYSFSVYNLVQGACVCAELPQSCLTLCNPMNCSPPGSSVHGILQAKHRSGLQCPPSGDLLNPGIEPMSLMTPELADGLFTTSATLEAPYLIYFILTQTSEKEMATHSSVLAWRIPGTAEPSGLPSMWLHRVGHDRSDLAAATQTSGWCLHFASDLTLDPSFKYSRSLCLHSPLSN